MHSSSPGCMRAHSQDAPTDAPRIGPTQCARPPLSSDLTAPRGAAQFCTSQIRCKPLGSLAMWARHRRQHERRLATMSWQLSLPSKARRSLVCAVVQMPGSVVWFRSRGMHQCSVEHCMKLPCTSAVQRADPPACFHVLVNAHVRVRVIVRNRSGGRRPQGGKKRVSMRGCARDGAMGVQCSSLDPSSSTPNCTPPPQPPCRSESGCARICCPSRRPSFLGFGHSVGFCISV